jgi:hypothetical protein
MNTHGYTQRAQAIRVQCEYCHSPIDIECVDRAGHSLKHQPAHLARLRAAGIDPATKPEPNLGCDSPPPF